MRFKTSEATDEFINSVHVKLGARNKAVLGRSGLLLALGEGVPQDFKPKDTQGVELADETVVGDDLKDIVRAALNHRAGKTLDEDGYKHEFRRHFEYGCSRLRTIWNECGEDHVRFASTLLELCDIDDIGTTSTRTSRKKTEAIVSQPVKLQLLSDSNAWTLNQSGANGLLVISGQPGSGKSQLALDLLAQISRQGVRFLFFDLKGELEEAEDDEEKAANRKRFLDVTGAQYVRLVDKGGKLPVNPLYEGTTDPEKALVAARIASIVRSFGHQMSASQESEISTAYKSLEKPDFKSLVEELEAAGASGVPLAILKKVNDFEIFSNNKDAIPFEDWISNSIIIDFKSLDNDTRVLVSAFILNYFIERLNKNLAVKNGVQPLQMVLFVDEAHNILPKDSKAKLLEKLAREGRSWGFPLWLASQDADKFESDGVDFATLATAGIHFSPQTLSESEQKNILGGVVPKPLEKGFAALKLGGKLNTGQARQYFRDNGFSE